MKQIRIGLLALLLCAAIMLAIPASAKYNSILDPKQTVVWSKLIEVRADRKPFTTPTSDIANINNTSSRLVNDVTSWLNVVAGENEGWYFIFLQGGMGGFSQIVSSRRSSHAGMGGQVFGYVYLKPGKYFLRAGSNGFTGGEQPTNGLVSAYGGGTSAVNSVSGVSNNTTNGGSGGGATMILNNATTPTVSNVIAIAGGGGGGSLGWNDRGYAFGGGGGRIGRNSTGDYQHEQSTTSGDTAAGWYGWGGASTDQEDTTGHPYNGGSNNARDNPYNAEPWQRSSGWNSENFLVRRNNTHFSTARIAHGGYGGTHTISGADAGSQGGTQGTNSGGAGGNGSLWTGGSRTGWGGGGGGGYYGGGGGGGYGGDSRNISGRNDGGGGGGSSFLRNDANFPSFLFGTTVPTAIDAYVKEIMKRHAGLVRYWGNNTWNGEPYSNSRNRDFVPQILMVYLGPGDPRTTTYQVK